VAVVVQNRHFVFLTRLNMFTINTQPPTSTAAPFRPAACFKKCRWIRICYFAAGFEAYVFAELTHDQGLVRIYPHPRLVICLPAYPAFFIIVCPCRDSLGLPGGTGHTSPTACMFHLLPLAFGTRSAFKTFAVQVVWVLFAVNL